MPAALPPQNPKHQNTVPRPWLYEVASIAVAKIRPPAKVAKCAPRW
jgi:hypothetical protein